MGITVVIIALLIGLLFITIGIYFKSEERSTKKLASGNMVAIILILIFILAIIITGGLVLLWLGVLFFILGLWLYFFGLVESSTCYAFCYKAITHEQKKKFSESYGLLIISIGILFLAIAGIDHIFKLSEYATTLLIAGGTFFGIAKLINAKLSMLFGAFCATLGIFMAITSFNGIFIELAIAFLGVAGGFLLLIELAMKQS
jgi:hypothetical protein